METACLNCRRSKRKCDKLIPSCSLCNKKGKKCIYDPIDGRKPATSEYTKALHKRIEALETALGVYTQGHGILETNIDPTLEAHSINYDQTTIHKPRFNFNIWINEGRKHLSINGQSSLRHSNNGSIILNHGLINQLNPKSEIYQKIKDIVDENHKEIFTWFFSTLQNTFPLVDEGLFFASLEDVIHEGTELGQYVSVSLINSIMSLYYLFQGQPNDFLKYKELCKKQLELELNNKSKIRVASVQTLLILSIICMNCGDETSGSQYLGRAIPLCYHMGLNSNHFDLVERGILSNREVELRKNVFKCCFLSDCINSTILGFPGLCSNVGAEERADELETYDGFNEINVFKEMLNFSKIECEIISKCYGGRLDNQGLVVSSSMLKCHEWKKNMKSCTRWKNNKSIPSWFLEISRLILILLIHKSHKLGPNNLNDSLTCLDQATTIIKLSLEYKLSDSFYLYKLIYSLYIANLNCLSQIQNDDLVIRKSAQKYLQKGIEIMINAGITRDLSRLYIKSLKYYNEEWYGIGANQGIFDIKTP
ncbi:putative transcriptional regulatory protein [Wickerhamomyces ciferrii]|uniref:Transcriptional regulatory protein n=1 Tax=Wickerhamomyces ciferrii (strain ATCC 14091 / BCRC 22168 / CBS 111 / JCM 3599 / NBRC 0793 / NRRL Y-1031 F-60-10) TaxID=1206466 RepID=K0KQZ4_WICCF|nr:putative transcriptional regulatory protein [Wickerhamomyces ciferrii]CCH43703.1 putative transcriptional regulatory protein [Wickerhamomyces ciferrii]